jgi:hypothetical protein
MLSTPATRIIYFYTEMNPQIQEIGTYDRVELIQNFDPDIITDHQGDSHIWIIVDDYILQPIYHHLAKIFCVTGRARNCSISLLTQNIFSQAAANSKKYNREILLNSNITIIFDNKRDNSIVASLAKQAFPGKYHYFMQSYQLACEADKSGHGYLCVRTSPGISKKVVLSTNVFYYKENPILFWERK